MGLSNARSGVHIVFLGWTVIEIYIFVRKNRYLTSNLKSRTSAWYKHQKGQLEASGWNHYKVFNIINALIDPIFGIANVIIMCDTCSEPMNRVHSISTFFFSSILLLNDAIKWSVAALLKKPGPGAADKEKRACQTRIDTWSTVLLAFVIGLVAILAGKFFR